MEKNEVIEKVVLSENLKTIGEWVFRSCKGLTSIEIPSSVTSMSGGAFGYCKNLTKVYFNQTEAPTIGSSCFAKYEGEKTTFYFKNSTVADALIEGTHYNKTYGEKYPTYDWVVEE